MKVTRKARKQYSDATKRKVASERANGTPNGELAKKYGVASSLVARWALDPRYKAKGMAMPQVTAQQRKGKSRPLIATGYQCPHCGERVEVPTL